MKKIWFCLSILAMASITAGQSLWDIATPIDDLSLTGTLTSGQSVFFFTAPPQNYEATVTIRFCSSTNCTSGTTLSNKSYSECTDASHANNTYFFTDSVLYSIATSLSVNTSSVLGMREYPGISGGSPANITGAATCSSGSSTCALTTPDSTPLVLGTNSQC